MFLFLGHLKAAIETLEALSEGRELKERKAKLEEPYYHPNKYFLDNIIFLKRHMFPYFFCIYASVMACFPA